MTAFVILGSLVAALASVVTVILAQRAVGRHNRTKQLQNLNVTIGNDSFAIPESSLPAVRALLRELGRRSELEEGSSTSEQPPQAGALMADNVWMGPRFTDDPDLLTAVLAAARLLTSTGDYGAARELEREYLFSSRAGHILRSPGQLSTLLRAARQLEQSGEQSSAGIIRERALRDARLSTLEDSTEIAIVQDQARTLQDQGDFGGARVLLEQAFSFSRQASGLESKDTLTIMGNLSDLLLKQGDTAEAQVLLERIAESSEDEGEVSAAVAALESLGITDELRHSISYTEALLKASQNYLGAEHPATIEALQRLAGVQQEQQNFETASNSYRELIRKLEKTRGRYHPSTLTAIANFGIVLIDGGEVLDAKPFLQRLFEGSQDVLTVAQLDELSRMRDMAALMEAQHGDPTGLHRRILERFAALLANDN